MTQFDASQFCCLTQRNKFLSVRNISAVQKCVEMVNGVRGRYYKALKSFFSTVRSYLAYFSS